MRTAFVLLLIVPLLAVAGEAPPNKMIEEAYFECAASRSLQGGIFGKGPLRKFGPQPGECLSSQWKRISRTEFKARASQWHSVDWNTDIPFFKDERLETQR
jgi:hypothetical protein